MFTLGKDGFIHYNPQITISESEKEILLTEFKLLERDKYANQNTLRYRRYANAIILPWTQEFFWLPTASNDGVEYSGYDQGGNNPEYSNIRYFNALSNNINVTNVNFDGYKYYLPRGIKLVDKKDYNSKLLSNGNYYYLYVDVISYYYKSSLDYKVNNDIYFSKKISYDDKEGYIEIEKKDDDKYFLKIVYNYSKIEVYVDINSLNSAISDSIKLLSSVTYNDIVLATIIGENTLNYQEEQFSLFDSKREDGTFLDYIEEYDVYDEEDNELKDEDILDSES